MRPATGAETSEFATTDLTQYVMGAGPKHRVFRAALGALRRARGKGCWIVAASGEKSSTPMLCADHHRIDSLGG
jgi:hypothetical protein